MKCGGFSYTEINDEHLTIINSKKDEIEAILIQKGRNGKIEHFEIIDIQQQVVAGVNYLFKIKLQKELNLDPQKARTLFNTYHAKVPFVRQLSQDLSEFASNEGLLFTLGDRFCRFDKWESRDKEWNPETNRFTEVKLYPTEEEAIDGYKLEQMTKYKKLTDPECEYFKKFYTRAFTYKALNRLVQGSAADMTKKAMVDLYKKGIVPHIQIHDELCVSIPIKDQETRTMVQETMEQAIKLEINNKVDCEYGPNWGSIK